MGILVLEFHEAHGFEQRHRARPIDPGVEFENLHRQQHVLEHRPPGQQRWVLKHDADLLGRADLLGAVDLDGACGAALEPGDQAEKGGLAAAGCAHHGDEFACADPQARIVEGAHPLAGSAAERLGDGCELDHRGGRVLRRWRRHCVAWPSCWLVRGAAVEEVQAKSMVPPQRSWQGLLLGGVSSA
jgi:hypothetical protein